MIEVERHIVAAQVARRDRIVVSTLRCGRSNLGSNPSHGIAVRQCHGSWADILEFPLIHWQSLWRTETIRYVLLLL